MKTLNELKEMARNFFIENGMNENSYFQSQDTYVNDEKFIITTEKRFNPFANKELDYTTVNGLCVSVKIVHRSNGTEANQSISVEVNEWSNNSGKLIHREKIYSRFSDKKIKTQLENVLTAYNK